MSWNNVTPLWRLNDELQEATELFRNDEITKQEVYDRIKAVEEIPQSVKDSWNPDEEKFEDSEED